jgi:multiple sugar transport system substrate-binding protein
LKDRGRRTVALVLLAVTGCAAVGCSRQHDDAGSIRLWAMGSEGEVAEQFVPEFEHRNPGLRVDVQRVPWSAAHEKLLTAWVGGAMPDVVQVGNTWIPELVVLGALEPLDARLAASTTVDRADYFTGIFDTNVVGGKVWGVPWYVDTRLLFYRSDLLAAAGHPAPPLTWAAWTDAMEAIKAHGGAGRYGVLLPFGEWQPLVILALGRGATLLRDGDCRGDFRSPAFRDALAFYADLFREGLAPLEGAGAAANLYQDFGRGDVAFVLTGPWNLGEFARRLPARLAGRWSTVPMPAARGEPPGPSLAGGASLVLVQGSARSAAAWRWIEFLSEPAQQVRLHELTGDLPARRAAWEAESLARVPEMRAFQTQLENVRATPKIPEWERIAAKIAQYAEATVRSELTIDDALTALDADVDGILEKRRWLGRCGAEG